MSYSRGYDRKDNRRPEPYVSPWEHGFPQLGHQQADVASLAGNLIGQLLGRSAGVGGNLMNSMGPALQPARSSISPLGGGAYGGHRDRDYMPRSGRMSPRQRSSRRSRSRSRSRDASRRGGARDEKSSHKRSRSSERPAHEIYIGNYPGRFRESDVRKLFEEHDVKVLNIRLKYEGQKVFAFAETDSKEQVDKAVEALDSKEIGGRRLRVRSAKGRDDRPEVKVVELTEAHVKRHLAYAFVAFVDRQLSGSEFDGDKLKTAKEAVRQAFNLPESDNSLKVGARLETIFFQRTRREIAPPKAEEKVETAQKPSGGGDDNVKEPAAANGENGDDDSGNWKRRKVEAKNDEDEEFDFDAPVFEDNWLDESQKSENVEEAAAGNGKPAEAANDGKAEDAKTEVAPVQAEEGDVAKQEPETEEKEEEEEKAETDDFEMEEGSPLKSGRGGVGRGRGASGRARRSRGRKA